MECSAPYNRRRDRRALSAYTQQMTIAFPVLYVCVTPPPPPTLRLRVQRLGLGSLVSCHTRIEKIEKFHRRRMGNRNLFRPADMTKNLN